MARRRRAVHRGARRRHTGHRGGGGQQLAPFCRLLGDPRNIPFPFRPRDAPQDMPVDDFARLFGPGGSLDQFFAQWIRPYVDTTQRPWRLVATAGLAPPVTQADVLQLERAQAIRDAFFPVAP